MKNRIYPSLVGLLLGSLQTGLYFQLSFTLSSSYRTFLMITVSWLLGSVLGVIIAKHTTLTLKGFLALAIGMYFTCLGLLGAAPFNTDLWPVYAVLIVGAGLYPGVFFVRLSQQYNAQTLLFGENNGFIGGIVLGTILFLIAGRIVLWVIPLVLATLVLIGSEYKASNTTLA